MSNYGILNHTEYTMTILKAQKGVSSYWKHTMDTSGTAEKCQHIYHNARTADTQGKQIRNSEIQEPFLSTSLQMHYIKKLNSAPCNYS